MKDLIGQDLILSKNVIYPKNLPVEAKSVGRLVEVIDDIGVVLFFEGRGRVNVPVTSISWPTFKVGQRVYVREHGAGVVTEIWVSSAPIYMYRVRLDSGSDPAYEASRLRRIPETTGVPMNISELAKHMIDAGSGCNPNSVPEWFQPVVNALKDLPQLSQMGQAQMEFVIKNHMTYRAIDNRRDLVTNVLFVIRACTSHRQLKTMEEKLYGYKEKLDTEWKKLDKIIPIEFQYAALMAYAETLND